MHSKHSHSTSPQSTLTPVSPLATSAGCFPFLQKRALQDSVYCNFSHSKVCSNLVSLTPSGGVLWHFSIIENSRGFHTLGLRPLICFGVSNHSFCLTHAFSPVCQDIICVGEFSPRHWELWVESSYNTRHEFMPVRTHCPHHWLINHLLLQKSGLTPPLQGALEGQGTTNGVTSQSLVSERLLGRPKM